MADAASISQNRAVLVLTDYEVQTLLLVLPEVVELDGRQMKAYQRTIRALRNVNKSRVKAHDPFGMGAR